MANIRRVAALKALAQALRGASAPGTPGVGARLAALPRMLRSAINGSYPYLDRGRLGLAALAAVYVISPIDAIPDLLPIIGLGDDALVVAWLAGAVLSETGAFLDWERSGGAQGEAAGTAGAAPSEPVVVPGEVIR